MGALEELVVAWRNNPSADATRELCGRLAPHPREDWVREIGTRAEARYGNDARVMLAAGRMYLGAQMLAEAQSAFVAASRADASSPEPLCWLAEVLVRRGDAVRGERAFFRARELGADENTIVAWRERAQRLAQLAALEAARELPTQALAVGGGVIMDAKSRPSRPPKAPAAAAEMPLPSFEADPTEVSEVYTRKGSKAKMVPPNGSGRNPLRGAGAPPRGRAPTPPTPAAPPAAPRRPPAALDDDDPTRMNPVADRLSLRRAAASTDDDDPTRMTPMADRLSLRRKPATTTDDDDPTRMNPVADRLSLRRKPASADEEDPTQMVHMPSFDELDESLPSFEDIPTDVKRPAATPAPAPVLPPLQRAPLGRSSAARSPTARSPVPSGAPIRSAPPPLASPPPLARSAPPAAPPSQGAQPVARSAAPPFGSPSSYGAPPFARSATPGLPGPSSRPVPAFAESPFADGSAFADDSAAGENVEPSPAIVLEHLARVGLFEPGGGALPAWERAPRQKTRGVIPLVIGILLVGGGGFAGYRYSMQLKQAKAEQAAALTNEVDKLLHSGRTADLEASDHKLSHVFDLDSRSRRAARQWLENRVLGALLLKAEPRGIDSAVHRGRVAGLAEHELAVGRVASFFVEGDLAGAAAALPKWDALAANDAVYQLTAGAVLQRAGDPRALERYAAARALDPNLVPASMLLARLLLLEQGPEKARPVLDDLERSLGTDSAIVRALDALAWTVDPQRSPEPPEKARLSPELAATLPAPLLGIPPMVDATIALAQNDLSKAAKALDSALGYTDGPAIASSIGFVAIDGGDEQLARKAALKALSFSAMYPRARTLAARVALLGGRLDEAQKAVEELDPKSSDVAVVRSAVAYENGDAAELEAALSLLGSGRSSPPFAALAAGPSVLQGGRSLDAQKLEALAAPSIPWGELVAADSALASGNLDLAERVLAQRTNANAAPVHLLRVARLRRYQNRLDDALTASERALAEKPTAPLAIERVIELVEKERASEAREFVARHQGALGASAGWLSVVVDMAANQPKLAAARLAQLEPPSADAPVYLRLIAARALAVSKDKRARGYVLDLARRLGKHPDALEAAALLNKH